MTIEEYRQQQLDKYYDEHPAPENAEYRHISENTVAEVTHMSYEDYLKKTGYKTYEEIKKDLGL